MAVKLWLPALNGLKDVSLSFDNTKPYSLPKPYIPRNEQMRILSCWLCLLLMLVLSHGASQSAAQDKSDQTEAVQEASPEKASDGAATDSGAAAAKTETDKSWTSLMPAEGLEDWEITDFGSEGEVHRDGELIVLEKGNPLTGINFKKKFPKEGYEIEFSANRMEGNDFLCGLTFPVGDEFCSFIGGGWGGGVVGLSSVDGYDAAENATSFYRSFDNNQWYMFRLRVDAESITGWIDDKQAVKVERDGHKFSTRIEVYASRPLGFCAFSSKVALRDIRWRKLTAAEQQP